MSEFTRITPASVQAAYQQTGVRPIRGLYQWRNADLEIDAACGLGACALARGQCVFALSRSLDREYVCGFLRGFDGKDSDFTDQSTPEYHAGYEDGSGAAALVGLTH
jgi:hypothetical protein